MCDIAAMPDAAVLGDLDPYEIMDDEAARIDRHLSALVAPELAAPSRCAGWSVKDVAGHLAASEWYNHACLDDALGPLFERLGAKGATDLNSFNALGVDEYRDRDIDAVLAEWRQSCGRTRSELRQRDGGDLP